MPVTQLHNSTNNLPPGESSGPVSQLNMALGYRWTANRFALLNFSTKKDGEEGAVDFNWFHFKGENNYAAHNDISTTATL